ncbi:hypothetical protein [Oceaniglobus ichthyenteri]|uniref:hypothetical protein n=1 Tax=Oceaniglobus ichthyenteri TaxID=2136177 RepID=UPI000D35406C|nr:hypothetical protein [Oceaniglobus ichthyenteri]
MNDMTVTEPNTAIALPAPTQLAAVLTNKAETNDLLARMIADGDAEFASLSPDTAKGRKALISLANKASTTRAEIIRQAKALTEEWRTKTAAVNAGKKAFEDGLAEARDKWRKPVTDWEVAEESRVEMHQRNLNSFDLGRVDGSSSSEDIRAWVAHVEALTTGPEWDEFQPIAEARKEAALAHYRTLLAAAVKAEADAAELARLRAEADARARKDAEEAAAKAEADRLAAEKVKQERIAAEKIEADRIAAERAEVKRIADEKAEAARREQHERDKAEAAERARVEAQQQAEHDRIAADERHKKELAEAKAREEAAAQRERDRLEIERRAEADARAKREADQAHRARIRNEIAAGLKALEAGNWFALADALIDGKVPHCEVRI